jgi:hypothetical protein
VETPLLEDPRDAFRLVKDVLARKRPWMRTHLLNVDLNFTHYGPFPPDFDPILRDAVALAVDTDGVERHFDLGLMDVTAFVKAMLDAPEGFRYGGLARLRLTFDVSDLGMSPADVLVSVEMKQQDWPPAQRVKMGPWSAASPVDAGLIALGGDYEIFARAMAESTSAPIGQPLVQPLHVTEFLTIVHLKFQ